MSRRKEVLTQLKERVQTEPVIYAKYVDVRDGRKCFCTIGHLMNVCEVDIGRLEADYKLNGNFIGDIDMTRFRDPLEQAGLTRTELVELQRLNDYPEDDDERPASVLPYIDKLLEAEA